MLSEEETPGGDGAARLRKYNLGGSRAASQTPQHVYYGVGKLLRLVFVYSAFRYLEASGASVLAFIFWCLFGSALLFLGIQQPWKGRPLHPSQVIPTLVNGAVLAVSLLLWAHALRTAGPIRTIIAEYSGVAVGGVSTLLLSRRGHRGRKIRGLLCMLVAYFMFSRGWSAGSSSAITSLRHMFGYGLEKGAGSNGSTSADAGHVAMIVPIAAGLMAALRRLLARRASLKTQSKKRLHAISVAAAAMFMFPPYMLHLVSRDTSQGSITYEGSSVGVTLGTIVFGIVLNFYVDTYGEDRLQISTTSLRQVSATVLSVAALEVFHGMDFSLPGFLLCSSILALGLQWCSSVDIPRKDLSHLGLIVGDDKDRRRSSLTDLPSSIKGPLEHVMADQKSRRIALFLLINTAFMLVEFIYGFLSNSLGLISDAVHMLFDCAALVVGLYASYIARLPASSKYPFGYGRFEVLAGYVNAVFLVFVATLIVLESFERLLEPPDINSDKLMLVSVGGFLVNMVGLLFFHEAHMHAHGGSCSHSHPQPTKKGKAHESAGGHVHKEGGGGKKSEACHDQGSGHKSCGHGHGAHDHEPSGHDHGHGHAPGHGHGGHDHEHSGHDHGHGHGGHAHGHGQMGHEHHEHLHSEGRSNGHTCGDKHEHGHEHHDHGHHHHDGGHEHHHHGHQDHNHGHEHHHHGQSHQHQHGDGHNHDEHHHHVQHSHSHIDHNMQGIFLHVLADTLGSVGVIISTFLIQYKGWVLADPACSIFISALIISSVIPLLKNAAEIVLQRVPREAEVELREGLQKVRKLEGVLGWEKAHFWSFTPKVLVGSLHVRVHREADKQAVRGRVTEVFKSRGVSSMTVQIEDDSWSDSSRSGGMLGGYQDGTRLLLT